ncbi:MAG: hypothetical protein Q9159_004970 [Coniocarpon cinnabarinum]
MGRLGNLSPAASVAVGILVGLVSTSIQSIGLTLQRKSHLLEDSKEDELARRPPYRRRKWQIGMFMFVLSNLVGSTIQITTLPLPVLSTLQASGLVFNTICATLILGEEFTRWSFAGTALVAGGAILIALYGALPEPTHNLDQLLVLLKRPQFVVWMFGSLMIVAIALLTAFLLPRLSRLSNAHHYQPVHQHHYPHHPHHINPRMRFLTGMSFGFASAILSAHTLLIAKSAVELIITSLPFTRHSSTDAPATNQFSHYQTYVILVALLAFALLQLYFLHRGLKLTSTSVLYPFVFCIYNVIAILDGLIYFKQTDRLPPLHAGLIALGTAILLMGVLALSWRLDEQGQQERREYGLEQPIVPTGQMSALAPGMGIVEDTVTPSPSASDDESTPADEERGLGTRHVSESTPLLPRRTSTRLEFDLPPGRPNSGYGSTSRARRQSRSSVLSPSARRTRFTSTPFERENIWRELMDDKEALTSPGFGSQRRKRRKTVGGLPPLQTQNLESAEQDPNKARSADPLRRARTTPIAPPRLDDGVGDDSASAWKKRRRRGDETVNNEETRRPGAAPEGRSVSSPLVGLQRLGSYGGRRNERRVVEWVGGLMVSNHDSDRGKKK